MKTSDGLKWLGLAFGSVVAVNIALPLLDAASSYIQSRTNKAINMMAMDLEEHQAEHEAAVELIHPTNGPSTVAMGFQYSNEDDEYV